MSEGKNPFFNLSELRGKIFIPPQVKDALILLGWTGGLILIAFLCWFFTQPVRDRFLQRAVNRVLEQSGDFRRLGAPIVPGVVDTLKMGSCFTVTNIRPDPAADLQPENAGVIRACVFTFIGGGSFFPCAVFLSPEGKVRGEFLPLNSHGERILRQIPPGIIKLYTRRIEGTGS